MKLNLGKKLARHGIFCSPIGRPFGRRRGIGSNREFVSVALRFDSAVEGNVGAEGAPASHRPIAQPIAIDGKC